MKDLGPLYYFLRVSMQHQADELFLTQRQFALDILERAGMVECKSILMSVDTQAKVSVESELPIADPIYFKSLAGALEYQTFSHLDIAYAVQQICLHMHDPQESHLTAMKHTLRYLWGTLDYDILLRYSASSELTVYTDAEWAGCTDTRRSTLGYRCVLRYQPHLLVFEVSERRLPLECRGQISSREQWHGGGLLATPTTSGAPRSADEKHTHLL
jgi:hypothetical protein